jgi:hypothetical protein
MQILVIGVAVCGTNKMVFEGKGKATWRDHPSVSVRGNILRSVPGLKWAVVAFGIYVTLDQLIFKKSNISFTFSLPPPFLSSFFSS